MPPETQAGASQWVASLKATLGQDLGGTGVLCPFLKKLLSPCRTAATRGTPSPCPSGTCRQRAGTPAWRAS